MNGLRRGLIVGTLLGLLLMAGVSYAEVIWYQKITATITIPRTIEVEFGSTRVDFGEVLFNASRDIVISNTNDYAVSLKWTDAVVASQMEDVSRRMFLGDAELFIDSSVLLLEPGETLTVSYMVFNDGAKAPIGGPVTYSWTLKFYLEG